MRIFGFDPSQCTDRNYLRVFDDPDIRERVRAVIKARSYPGPNAYHIFYGYKKAPAHESEGT
jgi:hypothetical protein